MAGSVSNQLNEFRRSGATVSSVVLVASRSNRLRVEKGRDSNRKRQSQRQQPRCWRTVWRVISFNHFIAFLFRTCLFFVSAAPGGGQNRALAKHLRRGSAGLVRENRASPLA